MCCLIPWNQKQCTIKDTKYLTFQVFAFCNFYPLHILCDSIQLKYVDTATYKSLKMLVHISLTVEA